MVPNGHRTVAARQWRHDLITQYLRLQRELVEVDPASSAYQATVQTFRQLGYQLISAGLEDDLDRLLRIRVLNGGKAAPAPRAERTTPDGLNVIERRANP